MPSINLSADGELAIHGDLNTQSVMALWPSYQDELSKVSALTINLSALEKFDTAGLAWLLQLKGECKKQGITFGLKNIPSGVQSLARISDVEEILT
jgi:phospholipid transport system transporter-binding protein